MSTDWLYRPRPLTFPDARLVCFAHGGRGGSAYRPWARLLPPGVELCAVRLPGREARFGEPVPARLAELAADVAGALAPVADVPVAFFGHSLGGLLAFEVSRQLQGGAVPVHLVVAGCRPPQVPDPDPIAGLPDAQFVARVRELSGDAVLADPQALRLLLPVLRADFRLSEGYLCAVPVRLDCPITVLCGATDPRSHRDLAQRWGELTGAGVELRTLPGDHFFVDSARPLVVAAATRALLPHLAH